MSLFTSDHERRLWLWALVVMVAIYSTLGPAAVLVAKLREYNLLRISLALVTLPVLAVVTWRWLKQRPGGAEIAVALAVVGVYLMVLARVNSPEERTHLFEYGVVAVLVHRALAERIRQGRRVPAPAVITVVAIAVLGLLDECIQSVLPGRRYDIRDVGFNALAGVLAIGGKLALARARRWRKNRRGGGQDRG